MQRPDLYYTVMQDRDELREIDNLGEEEDFQGQWEEDLPEKPAWGGVPLLQAALCALLIVGMVYLKVAGKEQYEQIAQWYRQEMAQEIELPQIKGSGPAATPFPSPEPAPAETPPPSGLESTAAHIL